MLCFGYVLANYAGRMGDLYAAGRMLQVTETDREAIVAEQMTMASRISLVFSSAFFFLMSVWLMTHQTETNFGLVQRSTLGKRLDFCLTLCLYISFFSALFNAIQLMDDDNLLLKSPDGGEDTVLDLGRPVEWMLTCPLMQLAVPILAGEKTPDIRRVIMPAAAFTTLVCGLASTLATTITMKALAYGAGMLVFMWLLSMMNACIVEASSGGENFFHGSSFLRGLVVVIALTWVPFPIWYALSPEGFNIIKDVAAMKVAVAFLNVFSKGAFVIYLTRIRTEYVTRQKTMISIGYIQKDGTMVKKGFDGIGGDMNTGDSDREGMNSTTMMLIEDTLTSMGRAKDRDFVVDLLQAHLITSNDDILSLTKEYCQEIELPWGLILALKSKIRSYQVQLDDPWSMQAGAGSKSKTAAAQPNVSFSAPHIAKNKEKIETVARRQSTQISRDDMSEKNSNYGYPSSSLSTAPSSPLGAGHGAHQAPFNQHAPSESNPDEIHRLSALMESHQKNVNAQVDECRHFVMHSMDKIMNVLEQRLTDVQAQNAQPLTPTQPTQAQPTHA
jgi:bacteriorhodopsin